MTEYVTDAPEFECWQVQENTAVWRVGERVATVREGWALWLRVGVVAIGLTASGLGLFNLMAEFQAGAVPIFDLLKQSVTCLAIAVTATGVAIWPMGRRSLTIDWTSQEIIARRGIVTRRFPFSALTHFELRAGPSKLVDTAELVLMLGGRPLRLLETWYEEKEGERFSQLYTVAHHLAEVLQVPLKLRPGLDTSQRTRLTTRQLAEKYISAASTKRMQGELADMHGNAALAKTHRKHAIFLYKHAHELDPDHHEPLIAIGRLSSDEDLRRRAVDIAVGENADRVEPLLERAHLHQLDGNYELARADYDRAVELERTADTLQNRARSLYWQGQYDAAIEDLTEAVTLEPGDAALYEQRSDCWRRLYGDSEVEEHLSRAMDDLDKAIALEPAETRFLQARCKLLLDARGYEQAIAEMDRLCAAEPDNYSLYRLRGQAHMERFANVPASIRDFTTLIELLEKLPMPTGEMRAAHRNCIAMAYRLRSEACQANGDHVAADKDRSRAEEFEE